MILFGYTDNYGILLGDLGTALGLFHLGGLVFQLVCCFHRYCAYSSKSIQAQDGVVLSR